MLAFPPVLPDPARRFSVRLGRDHYVRVDTCDYSVNPRFIGRRIDVRVTLDEVDRHLRRGRGRPPRPLPGHAPDLDVARARPARPPACVPTARVVDAFAAAFVEERDLAVYDRAVGVALMATTATKPAADVAYLCRALEGTVAGWPSSGSPSEPAPRAGPTRSSSPPASNARSRPAQTTAASYRIRAARFPARKSLETSTSTTNAPSNAT